MPLPAQRDLEKAAPILAAWLEGRIDGARDVRVLNATSPATNGASNETILTDVEWRQGGDVRRQGLVFRVKPSGSKLFLDDQFETQFKVLEVLGRHGAPTPKVFWNEPDAGVLGSPFWV